MLPPHDRACLCSSRLPGPLPAPTPQAPWGKAHLSQAPSWPAPAFSGGSRAGLSPTHVPGPPLPIRRPRHPLRPAGTPERTGGRCQVWVGLTPLSDGGRVWRGSPSGRVNDSGRSCCWRVASDATSPSSPEGTRGTRAVGRELGVGGTRKPGRPGPPTTGGAPAPAGTYPHTPSRGSRPPERTPQTPAVGRPRDTKADVGAGVACAAADGWRRAGGLGAPGAGTRLARKRRGVPQAAHGGERGVWGGPRRAELGAPRVRARGALRERPGLVAERPHSAARRRPPPQGVWGEAAPGGRAGRLRRVSARWPRGRALAAPPPGTTRVVPSSV